MGIFVVQGATVGVIGTGRIKRGKVKTNMPVSVIDREGHSRQGRVLQVLGFMGLDKIEVPEAQASRAVAARVGELKLNEGRVFRLGGLPALLVRTEDDTYKAFSATCTHLDCIVGFQKERNRLWCNCHGGAYDLTGRNVAGPPPRPLTPYKVNLVAKGSGPAAIVVSKV